MPVSPLKVQKIIRNVFLGISLTLFLVFAILLITKVFNIGMIAIPIIGGQFLLISGIFTLVIKSQEKQGMTEEYYEKQRQLALKQQELNLKQQEMAYVKNCQILGITPVLYGDYDFEKMSNFEKQQVSMYYVEKIQETSVMIQEKELKKTSQDIDSMVKDTFKCAYCGELNPSSANFCSSCGARRMF